MLSSRFIYLKANPAPEKTKENGKYSINYLSGLLRGKPKLGTQKVLSKLTIMKAFSG